MMAAIGCPAMSTGARPTELPPNILGGDHVGGPLGERPVPAPPAPAPPRPRTRWTQGHLPGELGIWMFIVGDMLVFGLFFGVFMVQRGDGLEEFRDGRESLHTAFGAVNTLLLLTGSILVVLAMRAVREGAARQARRLIAGAMATGAVFIVNKAVEYADKLGDDLTPSTNDFYTLFYAFTGIHLVHLLVGMAALAYMYVLANRPRRGDHDLSAMESCASYWHLVDLLWVVLFPLFYLVA